MSAVQPTPPAPPTPAGRFLEQDLIPGVLPTGHRATRRLVILGLTGVWAAIMAIGALHVLPPTRTLDPMSRTISEYALFEDGWVFDAGVIVLALGSALVGAAMIRAGMIVGRSWASVLLGSWCIGLIGLIVFPKHGFGADTTLAGRIHWSWTLLAFFSLPVGALLSCWRRGPGLTAGRWPRAVALLCLVAFGWFVVLTAQTVVGAVSTLETWRFVGLVERGLSLTEMATVLVLGWWVLAHLTPEPVTRAVRPDTSGRPSPRPSG